MRRISGLALITTLLLTLLAACGDSAATPVAPANSKESETSTTNPTTPPTITATSAANSGSSLAVANRGGCPSPAALTSIGIPAQFPKNFPLPPGTVITNQQDRGQNRFVIDTVAPLGLKAVATFFDQELPKAGFNLTSKDAEEGEAEGEYKGNGVSGRWLARGSDACPNVVVLTVLAQH
jgi:hypothetical protein